jgi:F-type H+-transporting ATPase subunit b
MEGLGINLGFLLMQILIFIILLLLMKGVAYGPIIRLLEQRQARIAKGLEDARQAAIARDNADAEAKKILEAARAEAAKVRSDATVQAEESASGIARQAEEDAKKILADARAEAVEERDRILADLRNQVAQIAIAAANRVVGESLTEAKQRQLVQDFFAKLPEGVTQMQGDRAVVTSAMPLTDEERAKAREQLKVATVDFRVDPNILGGLVVRVGDRVVDSSVSGQMDELRESLVR